MTTRLLLNGRFFAEAPALLILALALAIVRAGGGDNCRVLRPARAGECRRWESSWVALAVSA